MFFVVCVCLSTFEGTYGTISHDALELTTPGHGTSGTPPQPYQA